LELAGPFALKAAPRKTRTASGNGLTAREQQVVTLLLEGHSSPSLAANLGLSPETVRVHRRHIYRKLGVSSQAELFHWFLASRKA
jgi:DNA-binding CsgD family transcriptional regulator